MDVDPVEVALARALEVASAAGDLGAVQVIVSEIRARRVERAGNVIDINSTRRSKRR